MQAVVLVGGQGTRLRPLTSTTAKPLIPLANRPMIEHIVDWLAQQGVDDVLLATQFQAAAFEHWLGTWRGIRVMAIEEPHPLGTAGAVANLRHLLHGTTVVVNGDNLTNLDVRRMLQTHQVSRADVTIATDKVDDPTGRGVVMADATGRVLRFQEKPAPGTALALTVNTGTYIVEPSVLTLVEPNTFTMWETDIFPSLIAQGSKVYAFNSPHLWLDAGTPTGYFRAHDAILNGAVSAPLGARAGDIWIAGTAHVASAVLQSGPLVLGDGAIIAENVVIAGPTSLGRACSLGRHVRLEHCSIWDGTRVEAGAHIIDSIIGYNCRIGSNARIERALIGDGAIIQAGAAVGPECRIAPGSVIAPA